MPGTAHFLKKTKINKFDVTFRNIELWRHKFYYFDGPCRSDPFGLILRFSGLPNQETQMILL